MSNGTLPAGLEIALANLRGYVTSRLGVLRLAAKHIPTFKVSEDRVTVPANRILNGNVDRVTQRVLVRHEEFFTLTDTELREPEFAAARLKADVAARQFSSDEDSVLLSGNCLQVPGRNVVDPLPQGGHFQEISGSPPIVSRTGSPEHHVRAMFIAASRLVRRVRPKAIVFLVNSEMFDELNELIPPTLTETPLGHVERAERLRIEVIGHTPVLPPRVGVMFGIEPEGAPGAKSPSEDRYLIDRAVGIEPDVRWLGRGVAGQQFSILSTYALRIKDPQAREQIRF
jgi:hypothetical protein